MDDEERRKKAKRASEGLREAAVVSGAGFTLAASIALGALAGNWLDQKLGTAPWLLVLGFILGVAAGALQMARIIALAGKTR